MELLLIVSGTTAVGIITLIIMLFRSKNLINGVKDTNTALTSSLRTHKDVVENLPALVSNNVSKEVSDGIEPARKELEKLSKQVTGSTNNLIQSLSESHNTLIKTLTTINTDGSLTEWVESLRETIEPLQTTTAALEQHYQTSEKLLANTGDLVLQWTGQRQVVESAFTKFSSIMEEWAVKETTHLRDIEPRIMERLKEVASTNDLVAQGLSQLQSSQTKMSDTQQELSESVRRVSEKLWELIDTAKQNQTGHQELIRTQKSLQDNLKTLQIEMQTRSKQFENQTQEMLSKLNTAQEEFIKLAQTNYKSFLNLINNFHNWHKEKLESVSAQHETMISDQTEITKKHEKLINVIENVIDEIPSKKFFNIGLILFITQIIISGVIAYGILFLR
jgi:DNA repair exonuclease SbcCD ATPase subunit